MWRAPPSAARARRSTRRRAGRRPNCCPPPNAGALRTRLRSRSPLRTTRCADRTSPHRSCSASSPPATAISRSPMRSAPRWSSIRCSSRRRAFTTRCTTRLRLLGHRDRLSLSEQRGQRLRAEFCRRVVRGTDTVRVRTTAGAARRLRCGGLRRARLDDRESGAAGGGDGALAGTQRTHAGHARCRVAARVIVAGPLAIRGGAAAGEECDGGCATAVRSARVRANRGARAAAVSDLVAANTAAGFG